MDTLPLPEHGDGSLQPTLNVTWPGPVPVGAMVMERSFTVPEYGPVAIASLWVTIGLKLIHGPGDDEIGTPPHVMVVIMFVYPRWGVSTADAIVCWGKQTLFDGDHDTGLRLTLLLLIQLGLVFVTGVQSAGFMVSPTSARAAGPRARSASPRMTGPVNDRIIGILIIF